MFRKLRLIKRPATHLALFLFVAAALPGPVFGGPIGTYTITYTGAAPAGAQIRVTAEAEIGMGITTQFDVTYNVGGLTATQARDRILAGVPGTQGLTNESNAFAVDATSIALSEIKDARGNLRDIKSIDIGSKGLPPPPAGQKNVDLKGKGVDFYRAVPGERGLKKWAFNFMPPNSDPTNPGTVLVSINGGSEMEIPLSSGASPESAAQDLANVLNGNGYAALLLGTEVDLDWDDPRNFALLGTDPTFDFGLVAADGPHIQLVFPNVVPEPGTLTMLGMGLLALTLHSRRRQRLWVANA